MSRKEKKSSGPLQPPVCQFFVFFFLQLCRLLTERKVYMKSPELTEISAKHTFTGLQYLSISQSEVVEEGGRCGGGGGLQIPAAQNQITHGGVM